MKLKTIEDIIDYIGEECEECLIVRNVEEEREKHWIEKYSEQSNNPEIIEISEELYWNCFENKYFDFPGGIPNKENEFYLQYYPEKDYPNKYQEKE